MGKRNLRNFQGNTIDDFSNERSDLENVFYVFLVHVIDNTTWESTFIKLPFLLLIFYG